MKRDFSNSTRQLLLELLDERALFEEDIDYTSLFNCSDETANALEVYVTEMQECIFSANNPLFSLESRMETLKGVINTVFDSAQQLDSESSTKVDLDASVALENYFADLQTLVNAISVSGMGDTKEEVLSSLQDSEYDGVFGDPEAFGETLSEINDPSKEAYEQLLLPNGDVDFDAVEEMFNDESLEPWELKALATMVDEKLVNPDGSINKELFEKLLACGYFGTRPGVGAEFATYDTYCLTDGYHQFAAYYNEHTNWTLQSYDGNNGDGKEDVPPIYEGYAVANGIIYGVDTYYDELYLPEYEWDGTEPVFMDLEFNIEDADNGWLSITVDNAIEWYDVPLSPLEVSGFGDVDDLLAENERENLGNYYVDPNLVYDETLANSYFEMFAGNVEDGATGAFDGIPGASQVGAVLDHIIEQNERYDEAEEAREEQKEKNEENNQLIDASTYESVLNNSNINQSSCLGVVVSQGDSYTIVDQHYSESGLQQNVDEYNAYAAENGYTQLTTADFHNAIYNPATTDFTMFDEYLQWAKKPY